MDEGFCFVDDNLSVASASSSAASTPRPRGAGADLPRPAETVLATRDVNAQQADKAAGGERSEPDVSKPCASRMRPRPPVAQALPAATTPPAGELEWPRRHRRKSEVTSTLFGKLERVLRLYEQDKLFESLRLLDALDADMNRLAGSEDPGVAEQVEHVRHALRETGRDKEIRSKCADVQTILAQLGNEDGWNEVRNAKGIRSSFKVEENSPIHSIRVEGNVPVNTLTVLGIMHETDLLPQVVPADLSVRQLHRASRFQQTLYTRLRLPWPFDDRDAAFVAHAIDLLPDGRVVIVGRSCVSSAAVEIPKVPAGVRRLDVRLFGAVLRPLGPNDTHVTAVMNLDLRLNALPNGLLNFFSRQLAFHGFEKFRTSAKQLSTGEHSRRVATNRQVYGDLQERLDQHLERLEQQRRKQRPPLPPGPRPSNVRRSKSHAAVADCKAKAAPPAEGSAAAAAAAAAARPSSAKKAPARPSSAKAPAASPARGGGSGESFAMLDTKLVALDQRAAARRSAATAPGSAAREPAEAKTAEAEPAAPAAAAAAAARPASPDQVARSFQKPHILPYFAEPSPVASPRTMGGFEDVGAESENDENSLSEPSTASSHGSSPRVAPHPARRVHLV